MLPRKHVTPDPGVEEEALPPVVIH
jgi:hypothetical protein